MMVDLELVGQLQVMDPRPVAIEALWDGDSQGWFLNVCAVVPTDHSHQSRVLRTFRGGGDVRLLEQQVPPWPEAPEAAALGQHLANAMGIPFYFPSPEHPEDDCPHWWQRQEGHACHRCGVPLLQGVDCRWRGACYLCHLFLELEAREATLTPEERNAPKCSFCGSPARGGGEAPLLCPPCRDKYRTFQCTSCGVQVTALGGGSEATTCSLCHMKQRLSTLAPAERQRVHEAAARGTIEGLLELRSVLRCGLGDAQYARHVLGFDHEVAGE